MGCLAKQNKLTPTGKLKGSKEAGTSGHPYVESEVEIKLARREEKDSRQAGGRREEMKYHNYLRHQHRKMDHSSLRHEHQKMDL